MSLEITVEGVDANRRSTGSDDVICCIKVPNELLYMWHHEKCRSYIAAVNSKVSAGAIIIKESAGRLEKSWSAK